MPLTVPPTFGNLGGAVADNAALVTALAAKADLVGGLVPANQLPSFVDDVLEYANVAAFPVTGVAEKIYVALDTSKTYRWSGSAYVFTAGSLTAASQAEMEAGTEASPREMSPLRVAQAIAALGGGGGFVTGMEMDFVIDSAPAGWVRKNGGSIGNTSSGAGERADDDTEALFTLIWNNYADAECPVSGGRGASAAADFSANKALVLPDARGRVSAPVKNATALDTLGKQAGAETHTLAESELPVVADHQHTQPSHVHDQINHETGSFGLTTGGDKSVVVGDPATPTISTGSGGNDSTDGAGGFGGGSAHNNIQPTVVTGCRIIKL